VPWQIKPRTLLDRLWGVMGAVRVVSANVVVELLASVVVVPMTTCKIRKAPRRLFNVAAGSTVAAVNAAGRFVGVAIVNSLSRRCRLVVNYQAQTRRTVVEVSRRKWPSICQAR